MVTVFIKFSEISILLFQLFAEIKAIYIRKHIIYRNIKEMAFIQASV